VDKHGRSGPLTFVTVRHEIRQSGRTAIVDEHDIVYRPHAPEDAAADARRVGEWGGGPVGERRDRWEVDVDPVLLFRFSALTFNAHRIHYDQAYAAYEGYAGLVVQGPLQALLMAESLRRSGQGLNGRQFEYRFLAPAIAPQRLGVLSHSDGGGAQGDVLGEVEVLTGDGATVARGRLRAAAPGASLLPT
jgi:3-methylfumaryl-CoA hydratase